MALESRCGKSTLTSSSYSSLSRHAWKQLPRGDPCKPPVIITSNGGRAHLITLFSYDGVPVVRYTLPADI